MRPVEEILADAEAVAADYAAELAGSPWMPREKAAQIAEEVACANIPDLESRSADNLDGWVAACEAVAAAIRAHEAVRLVKQPKVCGISPQSGDSVTIDHGDGRIECGVVGDKVSL